MPLSFADLKTSFTIIVFEKMTFCINVFANACVRDRWSFLINSSDRFVFILVGRIVVPPLCRFGWIHFYSFGVGRHEYDWAQAHSAQQKAHANLSSALCHFEALIPGLWERHIYDEGTEHYNLDFPDRRCDFVLLLHITLPVFTPSTKRSGQDVLSQKYSFGLWKKY